MKRLGKIQRNFQESPRLLLLHMKKKTLTKKESFIPVLFSIDLRKC